MNTEEICEAIKGRTLLDIGEPMFGNKPWKCLARLIGHSPDGLVLVFQVLDSHTGLSRDTPLAGDGWKRISLSQVSVTEAPKRTDALSASAKLAATQPIPPRMRQGIYRVLCEG